MQLEIGGIALGLREGVIALIVVVALYMVVVIVRLRRPPPAVKSAPLPLVDELPPVLASKPAPEPEPEAEPPVVPSAWERAGETVAPEDERLYRSLENEVFQLRDEVDAVRGELAALRSDMLHELAQMRASQTVSPIYGDAMQMAVAGYDPQMIAERCGIARAEAELVVALAKSTNS